MIFFARHGETVSGSDGRFEGFSDSPLTARGKYQATLLGNYFKDKKISRILVSPRGRTVATAQIVSKALKKDFEIDERLIEICYGSWETMKRVGFITSSLWRKREADFFHFKHPGYYQNKRGESYQELYLRTFPLLSELKESSDEFVLIISHSGVIRCARKFFEGADENVFKKSKFDNSVILQINNKEQNYQSLLLDLSVDR